MKMLDKVGCEEIIKELKKIANAKRLEAYPVGTVLFSTDSSYDPNTVIGGEWVKCRPESSGDGGFYPRMLDESTQSYVNKFVNADSLHKLTVANLPAHTHTVIVTEPSGGGGARSGFENGVKINGSLDYTTSSYGSSSPKEMHFEPPYIACIAWYRTA